MTEAPESSMPRKLSDPLPFQASIFDIARLASKIIPESLTNETWHEIEEVNTKINDIFESANHDQAERLGQFPIVRFPFDKTHPQYIGELVRLVTEIKRFFYYAIRFYLIIS